jgi:hypothetical protein
MRRLVVVAGLVALSLALQAPGGQAISPTRDFVTGRAQHLGADAPYPVIDVRIRARSEAAGADVKGRVVVRNLAPLASYRGRVTCLSVVGSRATIGIEIASSTDPALEGRGELWNVYDGSVTGGSDRIAGYPITQTVPIACPVLSFTVPVISGGYVVHDA